MGLMENSSPQIRVKVRASLICLSDEFPIVHSTFMLQSDSSKIFILLNSEGMHFKLEQQTSLKTFAPGKKIFKKIKVILKNYFEPVKLGYI